MNAIRMACTQSVEIIRPSPFEKGLGYVYCRFSFFIFRRIMFRLRGVR